MGSDRIEHSEQPKTKVSIRDKLDVDIKDIYCTWQEYNKRKLEGYEENEIMPFLMSDIKNISGVMDYFLILGLELINLEISKK